MKNSNLCMQCKATMARTEQGNLCAKCLFTIAMTPGFSGTEPPLSLEGSDWTPLPPEDLQQALPQFVIQELIGRGGMAAVYKGIQTNLNRTVAIKVLSRKLTQKEDNFGLIDRFKLEAHAMAKLEHPSIVSVYDSGETDSGQLYIVMEYVDGMDIHKYLRQHDDLLPQKQALVIITQVLNALDYAHNIGIIHRDIKPSNILIGQNDSVKIADFGLAKITEVFDAKQDSALAITMTGLALGTPDFIAPEALESGSPLDHRADLYAAGVMLYQLLTGKLPKGNFKSPSTICRNLDPRLDAIVSKSLEADPNDRYSSALKMKLAIDSIQTPQSKWSQIKFNRQSTTKKKSLGAWLITGSIVSVVLLIGSALIIPFMFDDAIDTSLFPKKPHLTLPTSGTTPDSRLLDITTVNKNQPFENSLGMRFVPVPIHGGPSDGQTVLFSIWETRHRDYELFLDIQPSNHKPNQNHPATMLPWSSAIAFCEWLTAKELKNGIIGDKVLYRLPTDHEWSCAVGIGEMENAAATPISKNGELVDIYPWGTTFPPPVNIGNYLGEEMELLPGSESEIPIKGYNDGFAGASPVGRFKANELGIYDLGGNVWELCQDWEDPVKKEMRVFRGMSWKNATSYGLRSSKRGGIHPAKVSPNGGFRVVIAKK